MSQLIILSEKEKCSFDAAPGLTEQERQLYFELSPALQTHINRFPNDMSKLGFVLQLGYFRKKGRFFNPEDFYKTDVDYVINRLNLTASVLTRRNYPKETQRRHRKMILTHLDWKTFDAKAQESLISLLEHHVKQAYLPQQLLELSVVHLWEQHVEIPSYNKLATLITGCYRTVEKNHLTALKQTLTGQQKKALEQLLLPAKDECNKKLARPMITKLKKINQALKPQAITDNVSTFLNIEERFVHYEKAITTLSLPDATVQYYANWVDKATAFQLQSFKNQYKRYFHLLLYIKHQYYYRHDMLSDSLLRVCQSTDNAARNHTNTLRSNHQGEQQNTILSVIEHSKKADTIINRIEQLACSTAITDKEKVEQINVTIEQYRENQDNEHPTRVEGLTTSIDIAKNDMDYFDALEQRSRKFQRRATPLLQALRFDNATSDPDLIKAIHYFKKNVNDITAKAPTDFLNTKEQHALYNKDNELRTSLYKALLFLHVAKGIRAGKLNLRYSYRYRSIQSYLIDELIWKNQRDELLTLAGLTEFSDIEQVLKQLRKKLEANYLTINKKLANDQLPLVTLDPDGFVQVKTPRVDNDDMKFISGLLEQEGITSIQQVLEDINAICPFTQCFRHSSIKHFKMKPVPALIHAGLIGRGCNLGVRKMANISMGINADKLSNLVKWCFSVENLTRANDMIVSMMNKLALPNIFRYDKTQLHTSSDGRKVAVGVESLAATYSFKYFGKDKGVSVYTFIDEREVLFSSSVFSSSERDATYVIDGLLHNDVIKSTIHSTDTHGFTDAIFAVTHLLNVAYAPRLKGSARRTLYGFHKTEHYTDKGFQLYPKSRVVLKNIKQQWESVLRLVASIKLHEVSASQIFKRLNSYGAHHPLYKALKEFGKIIRSHFLLTYYDDVKLRQRIERQLNRIEMSNRFGRAIFFANGEEFQHSSIEQQKVSTACQVLLQNAITLWNYLYLSRYLLTCHGKERQEIVNLMRKGSIMNWGHINLQGEYDFTGLAANQAKFNLREILKLKIA